MARLHGIPEILSLPYAKRQLVLVLDDQLAHATRKAEAHLRAENKHAPSIWSEAARQALLMVNPASGFVLADANVRQIVEAWAKLRSRGWPVLQIGVNEAAPLRFPPGHPRQGVLYSGHPAIPDVYYGVASFHRVTFEHKFSEAVRLLTALGARTMRVEAVRGWGREFAAHLSVPLAEAVPADEGARENIAGAGRTGLLYEAELTGTAPPHIPDDMVWYPHESTWQMIAHSRLEAGLRQFSLTVVYEDDLGINGHLKMHALNAGLELGGPFEDHQETIWKISGTFR